MRRGHRLTGRLRIGMIPTIAPYLLPTVIGNLTRTHPELEIHVREALTSKLIRELAEGRLDTAIVALPVSEPSLTEVALFAENFLLVRPGEDEGTPVPSSEMLREMKLLLLEEGHCFRDQALSFCNKQSALPREVLDASSLSTLVQMVRAGMGVTLIPEMAMAVETRSASVSVARFKDPQPSRTIGMIWRKTSPLARKLLQISEVVCHSADALREQHNAGSSSHNPGHWHSIEVEGVPTIVVARAFSLSRHVSCGAFRCHHRRSDLPARTNMTRSPASG